MRYLTAVCLVSLSSWLPSANAQETIYIGRDARAFHEEQFREAKIKLEPHATIDVEILIELIGIPNAAKINALRLQLRRSLGIKNALSFYGQGYRSIAYDPNWAAAATADFYLVLGHEAGHLFCEHVVGGGAGTRLEQELEADRFGGASVKRFEVYHSRNFFPAVLGAASTRYPEQGSTLYPSRTARLDALRKGYAEGSPCGGLAPVVQGGFVPPGTKR
jgi:hypothetical protein